MGCSVAIADGDIYVVLAKSGHVWYILCIYVKDALIVDGIGMGSNDNVYFI